MNPWSVFSGLHDLLKLDAISIDNLVFKLHYKATVIILFALSILVCTRQFVGDPIDCFVKDVPAHIMDTYCWVYSTYTVKSVMKGKPGRDNVLPGVGPDTRPEDNIHHKYYQWVCLFLFLQALMFYIPRHIWKRWEAHRLHLLVSKLSPSVVEESSKLEGLKTLSDYFSKNFHRQKMYLYKYYLCEIFNLANITWQIFFLNKFLGDQFITYGLEVIKVIEESEVSVMETVFPKMAKCTFHRYGPSGTIQILDGLCVLPLNILNENIFTFLWFWFMLVFFVSIVDVVYRGLLIRSRGLRYYFLLARSRGTKAKTIECIVNLCDPGDWYLVYQIGKNIDQIVFEEFLLSLEDILVKNHAQVDA